MSDPPSDATASGQVPPYFDVLFARLQENDPKTEAAFGRHVHWGYWDDPATADGSAEDYAEAAEKLSRMVCDAAKIHDGMSVLDCGCGFGGTVASINERFSKMSLTGVNIDARQLERATREVLPQNGNQIKFVHADACDLPLADAAYDVVLAVECIFHFPDRAKFFSEAHRVLRAGGVLSICDFIPPARVLEYLKDDAFNPLQDQATLASYGHIDVLTTMEDYTRMGEEAQLPLATEFDMTPNTLPTYPFLRSHMKGWRDAELVDFYDKATAQLEAASRKGMLLYKILTFKKPSA